MTAPKRPARKAAGKKSARKQKKAATANATSAALRTPKHGGGQLKSGNPGNRGGRPRSELRALIRDLAGAAADEALRRAKNPKYLASLSPQELRSLLNDAMKLAIGQPVKVQVGGSGPGGAIPIAVIGPMQPSTMLGVSDEPE